MKFVIHLPSYDERAAGNRVLHYLHELINRAGWECQLNPPIGEEDIAVYPDIVRGNPWGAKRIVRYMLYYAGAYYGGDRIAASECPVIYHEMFYDEVCAHCDLPPGRDHIIMLPTLDPALLHPEEKTVESVLFTGKTHCSEPPDWEMPVITKGNMSRSECLSLLRKSKKLYSLDHDSVIMLEAQLCGCEAYIVKPGQVFERRPDIEPADHLRNTWRDVGLAREFVKLSLDFFGITS